MGHTLTVWRTDSALTISLRCQDSSSARAIWAHGIIDLFAAICFEACSYYSRIVSLIVVISLLAAPRMWRRCAVVEEGIVVSHEDRTVRTWKRLMSGIETQCASIDFTDIDAVILNEGISRQRIVVYLAVIRKKSSKMTLVFPSFRPPLKDLVKAYREVNAYLDQFSGPTCASSSKSTKIRLAQ